MIEQGLYVKVIFRNGTQAEGMVESWSDRESVLVSTDKSNQFVIFHTKEDVLGVKICHDAPIEKVHKKFSETVEEFKTVYEQPSADNLRVLKLSQLKKLMNEQEKKIISEKIKTHEISEVRLPQYGLPSFIKKPRA